jgi:HAD superfamily hydrolase (TIGR01509 family)
VADEVGLVIFDCDGVLVDTERIAVRVDVAVLAELGWAITEAEVIERFMGRSSQSQLGEVAQRLGSAAMREFDERSTAEVHEAFERELRAVEGVEHLLDALERAGLPVCVASSGSHGRMRRTLGITGMYDRFDGRIFSATEVEHGKPAPDLFLHAAARMGVAPDGCAVIEDSVYGVQAAVAAGMTAYGYAGGLTPPDRLAADGAVVFEQMADLVAVLAPKAQPGR